ncbi:MAG: TonB-dependent receptor, partial [Candidatus Eisenbacteria bacterium]|nr:TonB-dependent receptor [Candidatus Eisenbacteria bacterium]
MRGERVPTDIARPPTRRLLDSEIRRAPGGFQDPVRVLSESRSVESMNEFATILSIRGGEPDQVLFLVDGFDAYNPYRLRIVLGGGLSLANPDVVESVELYAGGFSARYGNRTSGMVHLRTREGDRNHLRSRGTLSLLAASGAIEGPLPGGSGSWIVGARRTYYDLFIHPPAGEGRQYPFLQEGQGRIDWDLAPGHRLTLRASGSDEGVNLILPDESDTGEVVTDAGCGTTTGSIEHRWALGRRTSLTTRFAGLHDRNRIEIHNEEGDVVWADGSIRSNRFSLSQELEVVTSPHVVRIGGQIDRYSCRTVWSKTHDPNPDPFPRPASIDIDGDLTYRAFYLEDVTALRDGWYLSPGIRFDDTGGPTPLQASPRVALRGELPHGLHARLGTGLFLQYADGVQGFSREATLVISSAKDLRPERAFLASAGLSGGAGRFRWDVEAYDRTTEDLLVPADRETYEAVSNGRAHARGIEAEVRLVPAIDGGQGSLFRKMEARLAHGWLRSRFEGGVFPSGTPVSTERTVSYTHL